MAFDACRSEKGPFGKVPKIKPILGCEAYVTSTGDCRRWAANRHTLAMWPRAWYWRRRVTTWPGFLDAVVVLQDTDGVTRYGEMRRPANLVQQV